MVVHGSGFSAEAPPVVRLGGHPALVAFVSPTRMVVLVPSDVEGENLPLEIENDGAEVTRVEVGVPWATGLHQVDNPVVRPRRPPLRHLQRPARTGSARLGLPRRDPRGPRAVRVGHRQRHLAGVRTRRPSLRLEPLRRRGLSRGGGRLARAGRVRAGRRLRHGVRPATGGCTWAIGPAPSSACATVR